jgi:hypothetical protein
MIICLEIIEKHLNSLQYTQLRKTGGLTSFCVCHSDKIGRFFPIGPSLQNIHMEAK